MGQTGTSFALARTIRCYPHACGEDDYLSGVGGGHPPVTPTRVGKTLAELVFLTTTHRISLVTHLLSEWQPARRAVLPRWAVDDTCAEPHRAAAAWRNRDCPTCTPEISGRCQVLEHAMGCSVEWRTSPGALLVTGMGMLLSFTPSSPAAVAHRGACGLPPHGKQPSRVSRNTGWCS